MPWTYRCATCNGTFDVASMSIMPKCPANGAMNLAGQSEKGSGATGCKSANATIQRQAQLLNAPALRIPSFKPSIGNGNFDCEYNIAQGLFFVRVKMFFTFTKDVSLSKVIGDVPDWTEQEKADFIDEFKQSVSDLWEGKYHFVCTKPGWTNLVVRPRFIPVFTEKKTLANYAIDIIKNPKPYGLIGDQLKPDQRLLICNALVTTNAVEPGIFSGPSVPQRRGFLQSFQAETISLGVTAANIGRDELVRIKGLIVKHGANNLTFPKDSAVAPLAVQNAIRAFSIALKNRPELSTPRLELTVQAKGELGEDDPAGIAVARAKALETLLKTNGVDNTTVQDIAFPVPVTKGVCGLACTDDSFDRDPTKWVNRKYNIAAHEFGHMLGLPDEYQNSTAENAVDEEGAKKALIQAAFIKLCGVANVPAPPFGPSTSSLMSYGTEAMAHHYLTVWDALTAMTSSFIENPTNWTIVKSG